MPDKCVRRVILIDAGCQGFYGHHAPANELITAHCRKSGFEIKTLVNHTCPQEIAASLNAEPILPPSTYLPLPGERDAALAMAQTSNEDTFRRLLFQGPKLKSGDLVIVHTASFWHLLGIFKWRQLFREADVRFSIVFRFPPLGPFNTSGLKGSTKSALLEFCTEVMALWAGQQGVALFTDAHDLMETYAAQLGVHMQNICMPIHAARAVKTRRANTSPAHRTRFVFPGAARKEKGIELLADLIPRYLEKKPETEFVIQSLKGAPGAAAEKLRALATRIYPRNVRILGKPLFGKCYFEFLASSSAVLLPYSQMHYGSKTSQIFYESLAAARPVIVSANTTMAAHLSGFARVCGLEADETVDGFVEALLAFEAGKATLAENAEHVAKQINVTHNEDRFFDSLFPWPFALAS